ncbi:MAG: hypothetical protein VB120_03220 [Lachnospiraceae bacterium]|nr:hypothetical protein [Lachnospiraceae bacterium]
MNRRLSNAQTWGLIIVSLGIGMLISIIIPWWSFVLAIGLIVAGIYIFSSRCH